MVFGSLLSLLVGSLTPAHHSATPHPPAVHDHNQVLCFAPIPLPRVEHACMPAPRAAPKRECAGVLGALCRAGPHRRVGLALWGNERLQACENELRPDSLSRRPLFARRVRARERAQPAARQVCSRPAGRAIACARSLQAREIHVAPARAVPVCHFLQGCRRGGARTHPPRPCVHVRASPWRAGAEPRCAPRLTAAAPSHGCWFSRARLPWCVLQRSHAEARHR